MPLLTPDDIHRKLNSFYTTHRASWLRDQDTVSWPKSIKITTLSEKQIMAAINGFVTPFLLIALLIIANDRSILDGKVNSSWSNAGGIATIGLFLISIAGYLLTNFLI